MAYLNGNKVFTILGAGAGADGYPVEALHSENTILNTYGWKVYTGDTPLYKDDGMEVGSGVSTNLYFANYSKFLNTTDYPMSSYKAVIDGTTYTATRIVNTSSAVSLYFVNEKFIITIYKNKITARNTDSSAHTLTEFSNTNSGASYYYDLTVSGLTTDYRVDVNLPDSDREVAREASFFDRVEVSTGKMTFFAGTIPSQAVHIIYSAMKTNKTYHYGKVNGMDSDDKISASDLEQTTGTASDKVMSQGAVTYSLNNRIDVSAITQYTGNSLGMIMSQKAVTDELNAKQAKIDLLTDQLANVNAIVHETVAQAVEDELTEVGTASIPSSITVGETAYPVIDGTRTLLTEVKGKTLLFNQLVPTTTSSTTNNGITFTNNGDGTWTLNGTATEDASYNILLVTNSNRGNHKFLLRGCPSGGTLPSATTKTYNCMEGWSTGGKDIGNGAIGTIFTSGAYIYRITVYSGYTCNNLVFKPQLFDLTAMFGGGNEPTLEQANELFPNDIYPYDEGSIKSTTFKGIKITDADENETNITLFDTPQTLTETDTLTIMKNTDNDFYTLSKNETVIKNNLTFAEVSAIAKQGGTISVIGNDSEAYGVKPNLKMIFEVKHWQED